MASWVGLINRALRRIGDGGITSLTENSPMAIRAAEIWEDVLDEVLALHPWNSAITRSTFSLISTAPSFGFLYQYQLPEDPWCLRVVQLKSVDDPFKVEGRRLLTDVGAPLYVHWIRRVSDPNELSPGVRAVFSARMATELAYGRTGSAALRKDMRDEFERALREARTSDGQEGTLDDIPEGDFITVRG